MIAISKSNDGYQFYLAAYALVKTNNPDDVIKTSSPATF